MMIPSTICSWLRAACFVVLTGLAVYHTWIVGGFIPLAISMGWGAWLMATMWWSIRSAPRENWERRTTTGKKLLFYASIVAIVMLPAIGTGIVAGFAAALAVAWLAVIAMKLTGKTLNAVFGETQPPAANAGGTDTFPEKTLPLD